MPEAAVCYEESFILNLFAKYGLTVQKPVLYGAWPYKSIPQADYQDIVMAIK